MIPTNPLQIEDAIEIRQGRTGPIFTDIADWVTMSDRLSPEAVALYVKLRAHVNEKRGDSLCWPSKDVLALMMGFAKADTLTKYVAELKAIGAISVHRVGQPARCHYLVHKIPADWYCRRSGMPVDDTRCDQHATETGPCETEHYSGPMTVDEWYRRNTEQINERRCAAKTKRDRQRARTKPQVSPDTPSEGYLDPGQGQQVPDTPATGYLDTPWQGGEQVRREQLGGDSPPEPPGPQDPTSSDLGTENRSKNSSPGGGQPLDVDGDHRPRAREQRRPDVRHLPKRRSTNQPPTEARPSENPPSDPPTSPTPSVADGSPCVVPGCGTTDGHNPGWISVNGYQLGCPRCRPNIHRRQLDTVGVATYPDLLAAYETAAARSGAGR